MLSMALEEEGRHYGDGDAGKESPCPAGSVSQAGLEVRTESCSMGCFRARGLKECLAMQDPGISGKIKSSFAIMVFYHELGKLSPLLGGALSSVP